MARFILSLVFTLSLTVLGNLTSLEVLKCDCADECSACISSNTEDVSGQLTCLRALAEGKECAVQLTFHETWNVYHYCIVSDTTSGGWGFPLPLTLTLTPSKVTGVSFAATLVPTTGKNDIIQVDKVGATVGFLTDKLTDTIKMKSCQLDDMNAAGGTLEVLPNPEDPAHADPDTTDADSDEVAWEGTEDAADHAAKVGLGDSKRVSLELTGRLWDGDTPLSGDQLMGGLLTDAQTIANRGILPPSLEGPVFSITHIVDL